MFKICSKCKIEKSIAYFGNDKSRKDGYAHKCKPCGAIVQSKWAANNKEKVNAATLKWRLENSDRYKDSQKKNKTIYYLNNREEVLQKAKVYYLNNKNEIVPKVTNWIINNREKHNKYVRGWGNKNHSKKLAIQAKRRATKLRATPAWADHAQIQMFYDLAAALNAMGEQKWHVDHIVPLQSTLVCGLHCEANLCVVTATENISKSNRYWPDMPL